MTTKIKWMIWINQNEDDVPLIYSGHEKVSSEDDESEQSENHSDKDESKQSEDDDIPLDSFKNMKTK